MINEKQQRELDTVEKQILIMLFGSETIPEPTAILLKMGNINPNKIINEFEGWISPLMNEDGSIDGKVLRKIMYLNPKFKFLLSFLKIPDENFYLSNLVFDFVSTLLPGVNV